MLKPRQALPLKRAIEMSLNPPLGGGSPGRGGESRGGVGLWVQRRPQPGACLLPEGRGDASGAGSTVKVVTLDTFIHCVDDLFIMSTVGLPC